MRAKLPTKDVSVICLPHFSIATYEAYKLSCLLLERHLEGAISAEAKDEMYNCLQQMRSIISALNEILGEQPELERHLQFLFCC